MPSKKKKYNARFPAGRIKKIMQTDEEVGKVAQAVPVIISRTLELFVGSLLTKAMQITSAKNAKTLSPSHMKQCILSDQRFDFLKDLVKTVQDSANGEDDIATVAPGLQAPGQNKPIPERRKSSSGSIKEDKITKELPVKKEELGIKEELLIKEEMVTDPPHAVANCSSLHLNPNFYSETKPEQRMGIHQLPPIAGRKSSSSSIKDEPAIKQERVIKEELIIKEEMITEPPQVVANCSTLHLSPNFYSETNPDQRMSIHQPPLSAGYQPPQPHYQEPSPSSILVMDEDYDT